VRNALELSWQLDGVVDRVEGLRVVGEMLLRLVPADAAGWNAMDVATGEVDLVVVPADGWDVTALAEGLAGAADQHPMISSYIGPRARGDDAPRRLSDLATRAELERNPAYVEFLRPSGGANQVTVLSARTSATGGRAWALDRADRDFTDRDVELLTALQPTLAVLERTLGAARPAAGEAAERARLTRREVEVLGHVARGLTAAAIARLLRISEPTVRKHLENAYRKLGCSDRLLAVQRARDLGVL
jgi:DNA-binding CsgD family transcriptional regulator